MENFMTTQTEKAKEKRLSSVKDMTTGTPMGLIVTFFIPILIGNFFQQFYSFVDSVVVGKGIGDTALAAVGNTGSVHFLILGFAMGLTGGLGICISQSFGAGDMNTLRQEIAMSVLVCLGISLVITVASLASMRAIFSFLQTPQDMLKDTLDYFRVILLGCAATIFNNFFMTLLRSVGNSKVPLVSMLLSSVINIALDILFIFPLHLGVAGAALATVLSQVLSALYCYLHLRTIPGLLPTRKDWQIKTDVLSRLVTKGLPVAFMNSVTAVGGMVLQYFVNAMGTAYVAAYAASMKLCGLFEQAGVTVGLSILTFTGQNFGALRYDRIKNGVRSGLILSILVNIPLSLMQLLIPEKLTSFMLTNPRIITHTREFLFVTGIAIFPLGFLFVFRNACQGMGHTFVPMLSGILEVAMRVVMAKLLVPRMQFQGVAIAEVSAWIAAAVMLMITYKVYYALSGAGLSSGNSHRQFQSNSPASKEL